MIDYDRAELQAEHLLQALCRQRSAQRQRLCLALRLAWLVAAIEFILIVAGWLYML